MTKREIGVKHKGKFYHVLVKEVDNEGILFSFGGESKLIKKQDSKKIIKKDGRKERIISSPIYGKIISVKVKEGDVIKRGDVLLVIISMKMENEIVSDISGKIKKIYFKERHDVKKGDILLSIGN